MKKKDLLIRTQLFVPGHNEKFIGAAITSEADAIVFDLEDSVLPFEVKAVARQNVKEQVTTRDFGNKLLFVRVNDIESGLLLKDLYELTLPQITGFLYPKTRNGSDIYFIAKLLETIEYEKGFPIGTFSIMPIIEGASAVVHVDDICAVSDRVIAVAFGSADFLTDLGGILDPQFRSLDIPRAQIALGAKANQVLPIETSYNNVHDLEGFRTFLDTSRLLGFEGISVLHPKQIAVAHEVFTPSAQQVDDAKELLRLNELALSESRGVAIKDGRFIGPPMVEAARKTLKKWELIQSKQQHS